MQTITHIKRLYDRVEKHHVNYSDNYSNDAFLGVYDIFLANLDYCEDALNIMGNCSDIPLEPFEERYRDDLIKDCQNLILKTRCDIKSRVLAITLETIRELNEIKKELAKLGPA